MTTPPRDWLIPPDPQTHRYNMPQGPYPDNDPNKYSKQAGGDPIHEPLLQFFNFNNFDYLPVVVSTSFYELARSLTANLPRNPERTVALRKLLEAKDCAVRAVLYGNGAENNS